MPSFNTYHLTYVSLTLGVGLSTSLIQFSVVGQGCVPSQLCDLSPNYGGVKEGNGDPLCKRSHASIAVLSALDPAAGHC